MNALSKVFIGVHEYKSPESGASPNCTERLAQIVVSGPAFASGKSLTVITCVMVFTQFASEMVKVITLVPLPLGADS